MTQTGWIVALVAGLVAPFAGASVITGSPPGGPVMLHDGSLGIDLNADGNVDVTVMDQPAYAGGSVVAGSLSWALGATGTGIYRGETATEAIALFPGDQVGPALPGSFLYADSGLHPDVTLHEYNVSSHMGYGDPAWLDGQPHFIGLDVVAGSDHHYGWLEMSLQPSAVPTSAEPWYDVTVYDWAFNTTPNEPVTIPEPSSVGAILLSVAGMSLLRRRKGLKSLRTCPVSTTCSHR